MYSSTLRGYGAPFMLDIFEVKGCASSSMMIESLDRLFSLFMSLKSEGEMFSLDSDFGSTGPLFLFLSGFGYCDLFESNPDFAISLFLGSGYFCSNFYL